MIHIHLICLGKLKEKHWQEAEVEYLKRLSSYYKIEIHELREEAFSEKDSVDLIKQKEAEKIKNQIEKIKDSFVVVLDSQGQKFSSEDFADLPIFQSSHNLVFIIGGPLGLGESVLKMSKLKISLSSLTFTHQMARVILWEQIYRATMIGAGRKYHY